MARTKKLSPNGFLYRTLASKKEQLSHHLKAQVDTFLLSMKEFSQGINRKVLTRHFAEKQYCRRVQFLVQEAYSTAVRRRIAFSKRTGSPRMCLKPIVLPPVPLFHETSKPSLQQFEAAHILLSLCQYGRSSATTVAEVYQQILTHPEKVLTEKGTMYKNQHFSEAFVKDVGNLVDFKIAKTLNLRHREALKDLKAHLVKGLKKVYPSSRLQKKKRQAMAIVRFCASLYVE